MAGVFSGGCGASSGHWLTPGHHPAPSLPSFQILNERAAKEVEQFQMRNAKLQQENDQHTLTCEQLSQENQQKALELKVSTVRMSGPYLSSVPVNGSLPRPLVPLH